MQTLPSRKFLPHTYTTKSVPRDSVPAVAGNIIISFNLTLRMTVGDDHSTRCSQVNSAIKSAAGQWNPGTLKRSEHVSAAEASL